MTRGYKKKLIIFAIFAVILLVIGSFYLNFQLSMRKNHFALKNGEQALATFSPLTNEQRTKYVYVFTYNGENYTSTTLLAYTQSEINSAAISQSGLLRIRFIVENGQVVLAADEKSNLNGFYIANSCEEYYILTAKTPNFAAAIVIFIFAASFIALALANYVRINAIKSIERDGIFTYAVFVEAYPSSFGSNRYMAVRYSYLNENEEWVEAITPYAYSPVNVELLKNMEAIGIKYKGKRSVITESLSIKR